MNNLFLQVALVVTALVATIVIFWLLFSTSKSNAKPFTASDGETFKTQEECDQHDKLLEFFGVYFDESNLKVRNKTQIEQLNLSFLTLLKEGGFEEPSTLIKYRNEFRKLSALFDQASKL